MLILIFIMIFIMLRIMLMRMGGKKMVRISCIHACTIFCECTFIVMCCDATCWLNCLSVKRYKHDFVQPLKWSIIKVLFVFDSKFCDDCFAFIWFTYLYGVKLNQPMMSTSTCWCTNATYDFIFIEYRSWSSIWKGLDTNQ